MSDDLTAMSERRRIDDAGEKIGGARKDVWKERGLQTSDLNGMTPEEARQHVTKDAIWPSPDWTAVAEQASPLGAALIKVVRDRLAAKPRLNIYQRGTRTLRGADHIYADYIAMMTIVRDTYMSCRSTEDVSKARDRIIEALGRLELKRDHELQHRLFSVYKGNQEPFYLRGKDIHKAREMVADGWPKPPARARRSKANENDGEAKPKLPTRPHLDSLERVGLADHRDGRDVSPEDFIKTFGFRGVEFGNWLPDDERQTVLNHAYDAFHDLAEVVGVPPAAMSLEGTLAVAFGARGTGRAAAHYEPGRRVVNVTRMSGAGSLAHEFAHALDHATGEVNRQDIGRGDVRSGTGWDKHTQRRQPYLSNLPEAEADAWDGLMVAMSTRPRTREEAIALVRERITKLEDQLAMVNADPRLIACNKTWLRHANGTLPVLKERLAGLESGKIKETGTESSDYAKEAVKLGGKSGTYWSRPTELFARAFECHVFDVLQDRGARSDYLVHGVEEDRFVDERWRGNPYPAGDDRRRINEVMANLLIEVSRRLKADLGLDSAPAAAFGR